MVGFPKSGHKYGFTEFRHQIPNALFVSREILLQQ